MIARLKLWAAAAGLVVTALVSSWLAGRKAAQTDAKAKAARHYIDTRRRMDDVQDTLGDDPSVLRDWLRERGQPKRDL